MNHSDIGNFTINLGYFILNKLLIIFIYALIFTIKFKLQQFDSSKKGRFFARRLSYKIAIFRNIIL